jgi:hypothetical protein
MIMALISGCISTKSMSSLSIEEKTEIDQKRFAYKDCMVNEFKSMDDHVSQPETIANAVINTCAKERVDLADKFQSLDFHSSYYLAYIDEMRKDIRYRLITTMLKQRAAK